MAGALLIGLGREWLGATPLPVRLDAVGLPGCALWTDVLTALPVPNRPALAGARLTAQWVARDPGTTHGLGLVLSEGAEIQVP